MFTASENLLSRSELVIPGGIFGHNRFPATIDVGAYPFFAKEGSGAKFTDIDGREYIDLLCGFGAMINGYANCSVDSAAIEQMRRGDCLNQPREIMVELAEFLCRTIKGARFAAFCKNGSDATNIAWLIARASTGKEKIVCANGAYHGSHSWCNWCNPGTGRAADDSSKVLRFTWNNLNELESIFQRYGNEISAVMLTPFHHPIPGAAVLPDKGFWRSVRDIATNWGAVLILDDVRAGFRLSLSGSHDYFGFDADLVCFSKAIANTHPLAAITGAEWLRSAAKEVFASGTFWNSSAPMAAALENLKILHENNAVVHMDKIGKTLCFGLVEAGRQFGFEVSMSGHTSMPTMTIAGDSEFKLMKAFAKEMCKLGVFVHPMHNWFISAVHSDEHVKIVVDNAIIAFEELRDRNEN